MSGFEIDNNSGDILYDGYEYVSRKIKLKTYSISAEGNPAPNSASVRLTDSDGYVDNVFFVGGANMTVVRNDANTITLSSTSQGIDTNTTYTISGEPSPIQNAAKLRLNGSDGYIDDVTLAGGSGISVVRTDANTLTWNSTQNAFSNVFVDGYTIAADIPSDTLTVVAGSGIKLTADINNDSFTIDNSGVRTFNGTTGAVIYNSFGTISDGNNSVVADQPNDTLNVIAGTGIGVLAASVGNADNLTISNNGVTQAIAGAGISVSAATGNVTIGNTGVTAITPGTAITTSGTGNVTVNNDGVTTFNGSKGAISYNNFLNYTDGVNTASPEIVSDTFTFTGGNGISAIINAGTDTLTISLKESSIVIPSAGISIGTGTSSTVFPLNSFAASGAIEFTAAVMIKFSAGGNDNTYDVILATSGTFTNAAAAVTFGPSTLSEITSNATLTTSPLLNNQNVHALTIRGIIHNGGTVANISINIKNNSAVNTLSVLGKSMMKYNSI